jgi:hypothetical protein
MWGNNLQTQFSDLQGDHMQPAVRKLTTIVASFVLGAFFTVNAYARCSDFGRSASNLHRQAGQNSDAFQPGSLRLVSEDTDSIVGMWHVVFTAKGNFGPGLPPDGAPIDTGFAQWHSDGTEIMNSSRNPATGSFCLGVWKKVQPLQYKLNHWAISWDPAVDPNRPQGPANIREDVVLDPDGDSFHGTFVIDQYDRSGNLLIEIKGAVDATRVTVDTTISGVL